MEDIQQLSLYKSYKKAHRLSVMEYTLSDRVEVRSYLELDRRYSHVYMETCRSSLENCICVTNICEDSAINRFSH